MYDGQEGHGDDVQPWLRPPTRGRLLSLIPELTDDAHDAHARSTACGVAQAAQRRSGDGSVDDTTSSSLSTDMRSDLAIPTALYSTGSRQQDHIRGSHTVETMVRNAFWERRRRRFRSGDKGRRPMMDRRHDRARYRNRIAALRKSRAIRQAVAKQNREQLSQDLSTEHIASRDFASLTATGVTPTESHATGDDAASPTERAAQADLGTRLALAAGFDARTSQVDDNGDGGDELEGAAGKARRKTTDSIAVEPLGVDAPDVDEETWSALQVLCSWCTCGGRRTRKRMQSQD
ncbi:hypothetical protein JDV02_002837 [Purpureocillium takamizusanense]|uniref:Uncharacterized protein n=1 Tax=Purpureocillium takamizusanense TaxID=2060973 RepID=A0A9Q8QCR1_9HYPO|nr:uncharacterized protein JDV02_002837 [Purpureocillium takamizusanense]UNI16402.1 hypothetical protein JDV02_002837 [Purpureocillium takamizusanense]